VHRGYGVPIGCVLVIRRGNRGRREGRTCNSTVSPLAFSVTQRIEIGDAGLPGGL
jgi:hypothetical protein